MSNSLLLNYNQNQDMLDKDSEVLITTKKEKFTKVMNCSIALFEIKLLILVRAVFTLMPRVFPILR
jgi:hypothetical protein